MLIIVEKHKMVSTKETISKTHSDYPVKVEVGDLAVINSGMIHVNDERPLSLTIDDLKINFNFISDPNDDKFKISYSLTENVMNSLDLSLVNLNNSLGSGILNPTKIGLLDDKALYISFYTWRPNPQNEQRLINYVLYLGHS